ncbi:unnamed protein product [Zymoseptoria tritici ST99CH_3D1]|uniref:Tyrosinase copper-binding domain-containing protein n=1 Tax=Zymoseptoria tritici ST99CH_1E4 TaxID=1276532 RepID=A0A2H1G5Q6_ZYMTR|nr:unnamed protein product [Zymoseptoria tritici ST99CH_1E4]SMR50075.1 unnamed protein product [Zymoseptoria tritici ST99CH_3D1]
MALTTSIITVLLATTCLAGSNIPQKRQFPGGCTSPVQRRSWSSLSSDEKLAYINADKCLMNTPAQHGIPGAVSVWDEIQYAHIRNMNWIHGVGQFLLWHRYYVTVYERLMQQHCGWTGGVPYWRISTDADNILASPIWDTTTGLGGNGAFGNGCITDGPFVNTTLRFHDDGTAGEPYCITRNINAETYRGSVQGEIDSCMQSQDFAQAHACYENTVHASAHQGTGGVMADALTAPGDPIFFLHHTNLDRLFWEWQQTNPAHLTDISGSNTPSDDFNRGNNWAPPGPEFTQFSGDNGPMTTMGHVLWMIGILPNVTIGDVMDLRGATICAEYV